MKLIVQIPCLNEAETLPEVLAHIPRAIDGVDRVEVLIIDDGSTDGTADVARAHGADHVLTIGGNRGLANAFQNGIDACLRLGADIIVNTDGDHQYPGAEIPRLIQPILEGRADIVIGDRRPREGQSYTGIKKSLHRFGADIVRRAARTDTRDPVSGFRALTAEAALKLNIVTQFSYTTEMVIQSGRKRLRLVDVAVDTNPATRPSRLFRSTLGFVGRSARTIIQTYTMYRPLKAFLLMALIPLAIGMIPILRFILASFAGNGDGRIQSLILGSALVMIGVLIALFGLLADLLARQRHLTETLMERVKRLELQRTDLGPGRVTTAADTLPMEESDTASTEV